MAVRMYSDSSTPRSHLILTLEALGSGIRTRLGDTFWGPLPVKLGLLADELAGPAEDARKGRDFTPSEAPDMGATLLFKPRSRTASEPKGER
jgi:hypothetical protein